MPWNKITLSSTDQATGKGLKLHDLFGKIWMAHGAPPAAAMYSSKKTAKHGDYWYFTPHAVEIAGPLLRQYGAVVCEPPDIKTLDVLAQNLGSGAFDKL